MTHAHSRERVNDTLVVSALCGRERGVGLQADERDICRCTDKCSHSSGGQARHGTLVVRQRLSLLGHGVGERAEDAKTRCGVCGLSEQPLQRDATKKK